MKLIPDTTPEADIVMTPKYLAEHVCEHFGEHFYGTVLEPCAGTGVFARALKKNGSFERVRTLELSRGQDFFDFHQEVDWVVTNPPWSKCRDFLRHAYEVSDNVVFLITVNHVLALKARIRDMVEAGFRIEEVLLVDTPKEDWPQSGFQLGAVWLRRARSKSSVKWGKS